MITRNLFKYKGYCGTADIDLESHILCGKVLFINSNLVYEAKTVDKLEEAFKSLVDEYLEDCKNEGIEPDKPFSGQFNVRIDKDTHRLLALHAIESERSLNDVVKEALENFVDSKIKVVRKCL